MKAGTRSAILLSVFTSTLWGAGFALFIGRDTAVAAAQAPCVSLPDAVPRSAGARTRNPRACPPITTYVLRTTDAQSSNPVWKTTYSANGTYTLYFALDVSGPVSGSHSYSLFIFMPSGFAYQAILVTYSATSCTALGSPCSVDQTSDGVRIWTEMPVAGTIIEQLQIYGTWTAEAWVDTATSPTATTTFDIEP